MPLAETVSLLDLQPLVSGDSVTRTPVPPRPALQNRIAIVGNYLPRRCGIATFTTDLCAALHAEYGATELLALPVNDTAEGYNYPDRVRFELSEDDPASYRRAADFLNFSNVDLVCLQHEYGIFGGPAGAHVLEMLRRLRMPFVTTLHTALRHANKIGISPPPIETSRGWLVIYHGVRRTPSSSIYRLGLALFDLQEPDKCLVRGDSWVFAPEAEYERHGDVQDVVFPCGYTVAADGDSIRLYYGAADSSVALANGSIRNLLNWLDVNGHTEHGNDRRHK